MSTNLVIRKFHIDDYDAVIKLWNEAKLPYRPNGRDSRDRIEKELKGGNSIFLIAEIVGRPVGCVLGTHDGRKGWINRLVVKPEFRRQNIARKLVAEVETKLARLGIEVTACLIEEWNTDSMKAFEQLGYERGEVAYFSKRKTSES
jgi:ribosomal protein S18 acetylase RimI-like enzyme